MERQILEYLRDLVIADGSHAEMKDDSIMLIVVDDWKADISISGVDVVA